MAVQLATGNTDKAVTSASDRRLYAGMFGTECYVHEIGKMCEASLDGPNKLVVQNGSLMINGAHVDLLGNTEFTIPAGLQAQKRATLCGVLYTASADGHEEAAPKTYTGEAVSDGEVPDPDYPNSNLLVGGTTETFMPLYRVVTDGINALEPVPMFNVVAPYAKFRDSQCQEAHFDKNGGWVKHSNGFAEIWTTLDDVLGDSWSYSYPFSFVSAPAISVAVATIGEVNSYPLHTIARVDRCNGYFYKNGSNGTVVSISLRGRWK